MADNQNNEWALAKSPGELCSNGRIFFWKYPLCTRVTMDPESNKEGICLPKIPIATNGHCDTAHCIMHCLVLIDTDFLESVCNISSNWVQGNGGVVGLTLAPPPWHPD